MIITDQTYEELALSEPDQHWELWYGIPRRKPAMTTEHNEVARFLSFYLTRQLDPHAFAISVNSARLRIRSGLTYVPDLCVIPRSLVRQLRQRPGTFEVYVNPLPFVVEVWSRSTGEYDVDGKIPEYMARGDLEIWRIHPYERTVTVWLRQDGGGYTETRFTGGVLHPVHLPGVQIPFEALFTE